ncbi:methyltransferase [Streptomyces hainanensis]|uniref:Methyltransferase domain-containing protein n=1 Tax=Streptomyces hainanensis TaxID=402648 RepID=A0A4R4TGZ8_9ACTN|nr:methyltransferase [Streptomyces hainanensis]TDC75596.1 methyltransferase domain-containing protein [Streptomyces hainanensis]
MADHTNQTQLAETEPTPLDMPSLARVLFGHAAFQYLHAACELGLVRMLAEHGELDKHEIAKRLGLQERANDILLLGCTSLGLLVRADGGYRLADLLTTLIGSGEWDRIEATVAFEGHIVYEGQTDFTESLRTNSNAGLRRIRGSGHNLYQRLSENPSLEQVFYTYMKSWSELANGHLVEHVTPLGSGRLLDCGGGNAVNAIALAGADPDLRVTVIEIPQSKEIAEREIREAGLADRISVIGGDMYSEEFPEGYDTILFAHQLVIWTLEENTELLRKAYRALPSGGRVVVFNSMSNDEGDGPVVAALDSVYFAALPEEGGMIYSWRQHEECLGAAGFTDVRRIPCHGWTPHGIIVASKP